MRACVCLCVCDRLLGCLAWLAVAPSWQGLAGRLARWDGVLDTADIFGGGGVGQGVRTDGVRENPLESPSRTKCEKFQKPYINCHNSLHIKA